MKMWLIIHYLLEKKRSILNAKDIMEEGKIVEDRQTSSDTLLELETYFNRVNDFSE